MRKIYHNLLDFETVSAKLLLLGLPFCLLLLFAALILFWLRPAEPRGIFASLSLAQAACRVACQLVFASLALDVAAKRAKRNDT